MKMKILNKINLGPTIVIEVAVLIALLLWGGFTLRENKYHTINPDQYVNEDYSTDYVIILENNGTMKVGDANYIYIHGWAAERGIDSKSSDSMNIVLEDVNTGQYWQLPTRKYYRDDVAASVSDTLEHNYSGFEVYYKCPKELQTDIGQYRVHLLIDNQNGEKLIDLGKKLGEI